MASVLLPDRTGDPYAALARHYDAFTAGHDHDRWLTLLEQEALAHGLRGRRLLDVACGTGKSFLAMLERGYEVVACDLSPEMVARAREKVENDTRADVFVADMRALPELGEFDLVTCLDDAMNYLLTGDQLRATLEGFARNLRPGGIAIFDANNLRAYRLFYAGTNAHDSDGSFFCIRGEASADIAPGATASVCIEAFSPCGDDLYERTQSRHQQRHHPRAEVERAVEEAGLELLAVRGLVPGPRLTPDADEEAHTKTVYVTRKLPATRPAKRG
jgi:SAM-dependent methyltransferase